MNDLDHLLNKHRPRLVAFFTREAGPALLRFESPEDLAQGTQVEALRSRDGFEYRDEALFLGWMFTIARRHLQSRRSHWFALKRDGADALRFTWSERAGSVVEVGPGPGTFAERREQLVFMTQALALLPERDRDLIRWTGDGMSLTEQAARLGLQYDAAERARARAIDRLRKAVAIVRRAGDTTS